jgi:hypothetical protein
MTSAAVLADSPAPGMPCRSGRYGLAAAVAAEKALTGFGDGEGFGEQIDVDVGGAAAIRACRDDRANAVLAHVGQGHGLEASHCFLLQVSLISTCAGLASPLCHRMSALGPRFSV